MVSLDQVLLLQQKVESAVNKIGEQNALIAQLKAENDALHSKCAELTNALSAKTEQFSSFQSDQSKIEEGILRALERLNAVENTVLSVATAAANATAVTPQTVQPHATPTAQPTPAPSVQAPSTAIEPEPPISPDMTVEQAMQQNAPAAVTEEDAGIEPDISFDDAPLSPDQPDDTTQGHFDIF